MTPEEKGLLLKDICARLVYNPFCKVDGIGSPVKLIRVEVDTVDGILLDFDYKNEQGLPLQVYLSEVKPYLRPMLSMSDGEKKEFHHMASLQRNYLGDDMFYTHWQMYDWLNAHHFDYRGLITKGLAFEAPKEMYK